MGTTSISTSTSASSAGSTEQSTSTNMSTMGQASGGGSPVAQQNPMRKSGAQRSPTSRAGLSTRQEVDRQSMDYLIRSGVAGGLAGCAAKTVVGPLDRVKILFQTSNPQFAKYAGSWFGVAEAMRNINSSEGVRGLFKGHSATLLRIFPYAAIKFLAYEQFRTLLIPDQRRETPLRRTLSGSLAGVSSVFATYPLELIRVRLAFETKSSGSPQRSSFRRIVKQIYHEGGSPHPNPHSTSLSSRSAATATVSSVASKSPGAGLVNFYRGFSPTLVGMLPYAGISFLIHDTVGDWLRHPLVAQYTTIPSSGSSPSSTPSRDPRTGRPQLTASAELFSGAAAGLISQTSSYPLEVIRRRMQVSGSSQPAGSRRPSIAITARTIWAETGARGFFVGLTVGYMKVIPMAATSFYVYERAKWVFGI